MIEDVDLMQAPSRKHGMAFVIIMTALAYGFVGTVVSAGLITWFLLSSSNGGYMLGMVLIVAPGIGVVCGLSGLLSGYFIYRKNSRAAFILSYLTVFAILFGMSAIHSSWK